MTAHTMTFHHASPIDVLIARVAGWTSRAASSVASLLNDPAEREPRTVEELLVWADRYESTQPSYAADLRAIARRHQG
jgi:hypothetical protein